MLWWQTKNNNKNWEFAATRSSKSIKHDPLKQAGSILCLSISQLKGRNKNISTKKQAQVFLKHFEAEFCCVFPPNPSVSIVIPTKCEVKPVKLCFFTFFQFCLSDLLSSCWLKYSVLKRLMDKILHHLKQVCKTTLAVPF